MLSRLLCSSCPRRKSVPNRCKKWVLMKVISAMCQQPPPKNKKLKRQIALPQTTINQHIHQRQPLLVQAMHWCPKRKGKKVFLLIYIFKFNNVNFRSRQFRKGLFFLVLHVPKACSAAQANSSFDVKEEILIKKIMGILCY